MIADFQLRIADLIKIYDTQIGDWQSEIGNIKSVSILSESVPKRVCPQIF
jgi:hypothetical protein